MIYIHPAKKFFVIAVKHAKQLKLSRLNDLEAELMIFEHNLFEMMDRGVSETKLSPILDKISDMKQLILKKKKQIL